MRLFVLVCGLLLAVIANAQGVERPVGLDWLEVAAFAGHQTDYTGIFIYHYDNRVESSKIIHVTEARGEYEKVESLDGPKREIIHHDGQVWVLNNHKMVEVGSQEGRGRFPSLFAEQLSALSANYQAKLLGEERVAGYNTQVILFQPKDNLRYIHKIWVHTDSGLLLKAAVLDDKNKVVELYVFTELQIGGKMDRSWVKESDSAWLSDKDLAKPQETAKVIMPTNSGWVADNLPSGFKKTLEIQRPMHHGKDSPVTQIVYSDGMSAISIFIEPSDADGDDMEGLSSRGAINLYHKVLDKSLVTVVGEVPPHTVMQVLDSVRYNGK